MFARRHFRLSALFMVLLTAFSMVAVDTAEARRGGSFGSRGTRTFQTAPATPTSPNATPGVQRSMTDSTTAARGAQAGAAAQRPGMFGGLGGMLLGGLLFSGLFGMLFGAGFGGFGGMLSLLVQVALIGLVVMWFMRRRQQHSAAAPGMGARNTGPVPGGMAYEAPRGASFGNFGNLGTGAAGPASAASRRAGARDEIGISDDDLAAFERRLEELQRAYAGEDYDALRKITTPEMMGYLAEELGSNASQGVRNEVFDVKLLQGDVSEAWREGDADYATVALRYESRDVTRERASGRIVAGEDGLTETTELWTFVRRQRGEWIVSAIQQTN